MMNAGVYSPRALRIGTVVTVLLGADEGGFSIWIPGFFGSLASGDGRRVESSRRLEHVGRFSDTAGPEKKH